MIVMLDFHVSLLFGLEGQEKVHLMINTVKSGFRFLRQSVSQPFRLKDFRFGFSLMST